MAIEALGTDLAAPLQLLLGAQGRDVQASAPVDASAIVVVAAIVAGVTASVLALLAARAQPVPRLRRSWQVVGVGVACGTLGVATEGFFAWNDQDDAPTFLADAVAAVAALLVVVGTLLRPSLPPRGGGYVLLSLDVALAMTALVALGWPLVLGPIVAASSLDPVAQVVLLVALVSGVGMVAAARERPRARDRQAARGAPGWPGRGRERAGARRDVPRVAAGRSARRRC